MTWTSYQGIEVIESHAAPVRHPRWGYKLQGKLNGGTLLLLADDIPLVVCNSCDYNGITGYEPYVKPEGEFKEIVRQSDSVLSHINGKHHPSAAGRRRSLYTDEQIKVAIKIWLKWRNSHTSNWTQSACDELERRGFKPFRGDHWNPGQLGSLVRTYARKPKFKNIKAAPMNEAPMNEAGQGVLAGMVRDAAARESGSVAANARITERKPARTRVDFGPIIANSEAARAARLEKEEEEVDVPTVDSPNPTLSFGTDDAEPVPVKVLVVEKTAPQQRLPIQETTSPPSDYEHITELPDGTPMFKYKGGDLMVGKSVKSVEI